MRTFFSVVVAAALLTFSGSARAAAGAPASPPAPGRTEAPRADKGTTMSAEAAYALGMRYLERGYYTKALEQLNRVRTYYRDDPHALKAELAIADVHFRKNEFDAARMAYEDFARAHPRYPGMDEVVYKLGLTWARKAPTVAARDQTNTVQAVKVWSTFESRFPNSEHLPEVKAALTKANARLARKELVIARFYAKRGAWGSVVGRLEPMLRTYPDSPDAQEAQARLAEGWSRTDRRDLAEGMLTRMRSDAPTSAWTRYLEKVLGTPAGASAPESAGTGN